MTDDALQPVGPGPSAGGAPDVPSDGGDAALLSLIDRLATLLDRSDLTELEVESGDTALTLRKPAALATAVVTTPVVAPAQAVETDGTSGAIWLVGVSTTGAGVPSTELRTLGPPAVRPLLKASVRLCLRSSNRLVFTELMANSTMKSTYMRVSTSA